MTRDEAKLKVLDIIAFPTYSDSIKNLIDKIYDDFESMTCESCKYSYKSRLGKYKTLDRCGHENILGVFGQKLEITSNFGCNKWESKDEH